jgi:hypothetical protein
VTSRLDARDVEERRDGRRVVLAVLVHRDDPVRARGCHTGQRRCVLTEVAAQPETADLGESLAQLPDHLVGGVRAVVMDQQDLGDHQPVTVG